VGAPAVASPRGPPTTRRRGPFTGRNDGPGPANCRSEAIFRGGQGRGRTADLPIFSRTLVPTELPARGRTTSVRPGAVLTGFEPATSTLTGWRALHAAPQDQAVRAPNGIRTRVTALKGQRPGPLDDGGGWAHGVLAVGDRNSIGEVDDVHQRTPDALPRQSVSSRHRATGRRGRRVRRRKVALVRLADRAAQVALDRHGRQAQPAQRDVIPGLQSSRRAIEIEY
jgi:hypothetical protein